MQAAKGKAALRQGGIDRLDAGRQCPSVCTGLDGLHGAFEHRNHLGARVVQHRSPGFHPNVLVLF